MFFKGQEGAATQILGTSEYHSGDLPFPEFQKDVSQGKIGVVYGPPDFYIAQIIDLQVPINLSELV